MMSKTWAWIDLWCSTNGHWSKAKHKSKAEDVTTKVTLTGNLHELMWALAQRSCSSVIIITSWHLHVQVFAVGEGTEDEGTYCIVIQRMPTWNSRKSRTTTSCRWKTSVQQSDQGNHGLGPVDCWIQRDEHDGTENTVIILSQRQKMDWQSVHFLKHSNFLDQGWHPILVIRRLTTWVTVRQFCEKMRRLRLNRHNPDTKTCSTSRRVKNSSTMIGICNQITNLAQECRHMSKEIM